jgi:hypothetical protein
MMTFVVIAVYYFRRQAKALEYVAEIEEARFMRQQRLWRAEDARQVRLERPLDWLSEIASRALGDSVTIMGIEKALPLIPALDTRASSGGRVVFSTLDPRALRKRVGVKKSRGKSTVARLERFAMETPLLGPSPRKAKDGKQSLMDDEWFDVKAGIIGKGCQLSWGEPERLWIYQVEQEGKAHGRN